MLRWDCTERLVRFNEAALGWSAEGFAGMPTASMVNEGFNEAALGWSAEGGRATAGHATKKACFNEAALGWSAEGVCEAEYIVTFTTLQ